MRHLKRHLKHHPCGINDEKSPRSRNVINIRPGETPYIATSGIDSISVAIRVHLLQNAHRLIFASEQPMSSIPTACWPSGALGVTESQVYS
jgi:hypothetical protein